MRVVKTRGELARALEGVTNINFVPTMGALHQGHLSLVRAAKAARDRNAEGETGSSPNTVVSIFVNPTQFNDPSDLKNYPRTLEKDLFLLAREGVDIVFVPSIEEIYPEPDTRVFDFGELDKIMEGASRRGHFNGVAQVVSRLFDLVRPQKAFFGQKDFQQIAIIREMTRQAREKGQSWAQGLEIVACPTVREPDGLAMSSRNQLLTPQHRAVAPEIFRALQASTDPEQITRQIENSGLLKVIYCTVLDGRTFVAVQAGNVRLIDNYDNRSTQI